MAMARSLKISKGGQLSVPAAIRTRWQTHTVVIDDRGDHMVVRPAPDDPVKATFGIFADDFADAPAAEQIVRELREQDVAAGDRRRRS